MKRIGLALLALSIGAISSSCLSPQGKAFGRDIAATYIQNAVASSAQKEFGPSYDTNIAVNNNGYSEQVSRVVKPELIFRKWYDRNNDGVPQEHEKGEVVHGFVNMKDCAGLAVSVNSNSLVTYSLFFRDGIVMRMPSNHGVFIGKGKGDGKVTVNAHGQDVGLSGEIYLEGCNL